MVVQSKKTSATGASRKFVEDCFETIGKDGDKEKHNYNNNDRCTNDDMTWI